MRTLRLCLLLFAVACGLAGAQSPQSKPTHLVVTTPPQLVDCAPVTPVPCMSLGLTAVDDSGKSAPFALPSAHDLPSSLSFQSGDSIVHPFYASVGQGQDAGQHTNVVLLAIDMSGSMNDPSPGDVSRFTAVKSAVARYVNAMEEGSDEIAIVPFESHNVVSTIRSAVFSSHKADVMAQLDAIPQPGPKNNTALYQAVFSGVEALKGEVSALERDGRTAAELQPHLLVMTDGKNEVQKGDDANLLDGPLGLQQASAQVQASHLDVIGVGFGDRAAIDAVALQHLSTRFFYAADASQLLDALHVTRSERSHVIQAAWLLNAANRVELTGRDQIWTPAFTMKDGSTLRADPVRMVMPATAPPLYQRTASHEELERLIAVHPPAASGWSTVLVHLLLFLVALVILLILWFWVPRLIWGERFMSATPPQRWSGERHGVTAASGVQIRSSAVPPGFHPETASAGPLHRSAAQTTQVGPRPDPTRTRLEFD